MRKVKVEWEKLQLESVQISESMPKRVRQCLRQRGLYKVLIHSNIYIFTSAQLL